ncbi:MAG: proton-conducting transporter membrane subunit [Bacteroidales bacterium]
MVTPIFIIATGLGLAFALGFIPKNNLNLTAVLSILGLLFMNFISGQWLFHYLSGHSAQEFIFTAGAVPPFSITLKMGLNEAVITLLINLVGLLSGIYLLDKLKSIGRNAFMIFLVLIMALNVIIMTQDLFNLFVFLEIASIATAGLMLLDQNLKTLSAGFKYLLATSLIAGIFLIGTIFIYYFGGSLFLGDLTAIALLPVKGVSVAFFLLLISIILELKPFPANGWGLDVYQTANPGLSAVISGGTATAMLFALYKIMPLGTIAHLDILIWVGLLTFVASNLMGLKQTDARRLLGYSSIGQIGLMISIIGMKPYVGFDIQLILLAILVTHFMAKAGFFWLSGIAGTTDIKKWGIIRKHPEMLFLMGTFVFALIGFPPFPSFFGKWQLIIELSSTGHFLWLGLILFGSLIEGVYLFRWFGYAVKKEADPATQIDIRPNKTLPTIIFAVFLYGIGYLLSHYFPMGDTINWLPLAFIAILFALDFLPAWIKNIISIAGLSYYTYLILPEQQGLYFIFAFIFLIGGLLTLIPGFTNKGKRIGFYPVTMIMFLGMGMLIDADNLLQFFFGWELMTAGSYFLIIRGKRSMPHALSYMLFSLGGAYLIFAAFALAYTGSGSIMMESLSNMGIYGGIAYTLLAIGFMTKTASLGLHIWLPGAHAEAESDVSPMVSAILLKAGVLGLIITFLAMGGVHSEYMTLPYVLGWLGALTALVGNMAAAFQEDAKRLLAYSSIGQLGYILFAFAMMTHLGWLTGLGYSLAHFSYKAMLFMGIGGIVLRLGTHNMYEMGGLIKKMPFTFISVLFAIIALAGIPPLVGFAGKWLFYNAIIEKGWYFQGTIILFAGIIAFLYSFRILYSVFLGQLKDEHRQVREAPIWYLIPQYVLLLAIFVFSARPQWLFEPLGAMLAPIFPEGQLVWTESGTALSNLGYFNGSWIMYIIGLMFVMVFTWLYVQNRKAKKVKQFNIVYAGERPERPETTHMAYNMYSGYNKALGFITAAGVTRFWDWLSEHVTAVGDSMRKIYSGNGQTYVFHIIIFVIIVYLFSNGGF